QAEPGRARRHEYRPEPEPPGFDDGRPHVHALLTAQQVDIVDENDRIVDDDADQHDETHEALEVERRPRQQHGGHHADDRERHADHDDQRVDEALELRRHDHIDQRERRQDREQEVALRALLLLVLSAERQREALRHRESVEGLPDARYGVAEGDAVLEVRVDVVHALAVHAVDAERRSPAALGDERRQRQDAFVRAHGDVADVEHAPAVLGTQTHGDRNLLAGDAEHAGAAAADARLDRRGDVLHAHAELGDARAVEYDVLLGPALAIARVDVGHTRHCGNAVHEPLDELLRGAEVVTAQLELQRLALPAPAAAAEKPPQDPEAGFGLHVDVGARDRVLDLLADHVGELAAADAPLAGRLERQLHARVVVADVVRDEQDFLDRHDIAHGRVEQARVLVHDGDVRAVVHAHSNFEL